MNTQTHMDTGHGSPRRRLLRAAAIIDAAGIQAAPGVVLLEDDRIIAAGSPQAVGAVGQVASDGIETLADSVIVPALANVHAHLDLTHIGPQPFDGDFARWVERIRFGRCTDQDTIAATVREGVRLSRAGGTAMVGDIAGARSMTPVRALRELGMPGVSYLEVFGIGRGQAAAIDFMGSAIDAVPNIDQGVRFGLQPHAPYSCGPEVYRYAAAALGTPMSTHLAETTEELEFIRHARGSLADMLKRIGVWDDSIRAAGAAGAAGLHPVEFLAQQLGVGGGDRSCIAAHVNYVDDEHLELLAKSRIHVAYCPRASAYFGHPQHRYREMMAAGVNVALGTDSIVCLDTPDRISVLDEMRLLHQRDGVDAVTLLRMATICGCRALGMRESLVTLKSGESAGLLALRADEHAASPQEALESALRRNEPPKWMLGPVRGNDSWFQ